MSGKLEPLAPGGRARAAHVCLRPHRLRLRPHRQLPHLPARRCAAPLSAPAGHGRQPRHEHHRRGRQDHPQRARRGQAHRRVHRPLRAGLLRGHGRARHRAARAPAARHRAHPGDGRAHRAARRQRHRLPDRGRQLVLPHRARPRLRQALEEGFRGHRRRRARRSWTSTRRTPRATSPSGRR